MGTVLTQVRLRVRGERSRVTQATKIGTDYDADAAYSLVASETEAGAMLRRLCRAFLTSLRGRDRARTWSRLGESNPRPIHYE